MLSSHSHNHHQSASANDPRLPSAARPHKLLPVSPQDLPVDYSGFVAAICGVLGVMFRYKLCSWLAIIFCAQSLANMRNIETDLKQVSMAMIHDPWKCCVASCCCLCYSICEYNAAASHQAAPAHVCVT
ncbi:Asterix-like protein [Drosera capensis]